MKRAALSVLLLLAAPALVHAIDDAAARTAMKHSAQQVIDAMVKLDHARIVDLTYPLVVEKMGGREKMIAAIEEVMKDLASHGMKFQAARLGDVSDIAAGGTEHYAVIPYDLDIRVPAGVLKQKTFLIGISKDEGKTWTFINGTQDPNSHKEVLPNFPESLKLPKMEAPVLHKDPTTAPAK